MLSIQLQILLLSKDNQNDYNENNPAINDKSFAVRKNLKVNHLKFKSKLLTNGFSLFLKHK